MSNHDEKNKHEERIRQKETHLKKKVKIRKSHGFQEDEPHRYHKISPCSCGNSNCVMCGNPRKFFKEVTIQEKRFIQKELHNDD